MFNKDVLLKLEFCLDHVLAIEYYSGKVSNEGDFFTVERGAYYDASLMRLQGLSETIKKINADYPLVIEELNYPDIDDLIKFRDIVSHHYEKLEHEIIFGICTKNIPQLKSCLVPLIEKISKSI